MTSWAAIRRFDAPSTTSAAIVASAGVSDDSPCAARGMARERGPRRTPYCRSQLSELLMQ
ncbi:hypothetical protein [Actinoplanes sp. NPDC051411]|uniref:hypothetical protein n=1 Tax=Actinoplanes sp. NPDC051411 TaxID=3155522 RepID=UPI0034139DB7